MKDISNKLVSLFREGYCTPQIARVAKKIKEASSTIHYNIKKLEKTGAIRAYKAVFDYAKIDQGFCAYVLVTLAENDYADPEIIGNALKKYDEIESIDVCTGDWELVLKIRVKDQNAYYEFVKQVLRNNGVKKTKTLVSFKQLKTEFVAC